MIFTQPTVILVEEMVANGSNGDLAKVHHLASLSEGAVGVFALLALAGKIGAHFLREVCEKSIASLHIRLV